MFSCSVVLPCKTPSCCESISSFLGVPSFFELAIIYFRQRARHPENRYNNFLPLSPSRERGQTLSGALSAACLMACSDVAHGTQGSINSSGSAANRYKFLLAVDLRRFGTGEYADSDDWTGGTVACAGGAIDYAVKVPTGSGSRLVVRQGEEADKEAAREEFWRLATRCKAATRDMVKKETLR